MAYLAAILLIKFSIYEEFGESCNFRGLVSVW